MTQISPGSTSILPNSVKNSSEFVLRHDQQLGVGVVEILVLHRLGDEIDVRGHAGLGVDVAGSRHGAQAGEEGEVLLGDRHGAPAQLADRPVVLGRGRCRLPERQRGLAELGAVLHRRADAVEPGALVGAARRGEGRARQLLGVEAVGGALRRVLSDRQGTRQRFGLEVVAEARHVADRRRLRILPTALAAAAGCASCSVCHDGVPPRFVDPGGELRPRPEPVEGRLACNHAVLRQAQHWVICQPRMTTTGSHDSFV